MYFIRVLSSYVSDCWDNLTSSTSKLKQKDQVNIFQIPFKNQFGLLLGVLRAGMATEDVFMLGYWFCLLTALLGFGEAFKEFVHVYSDRHYVPKTFWNREYRHIPFEHRRNARIVGSGINIAVNLFFFYGFLNLRHVYIMPWVVINAIIIGLESFYWISHAVHNRVFKWKPFLSLLFLILRFTIVIEVMLTIADLD